MYQVYMLYFWYFLPGEFNTLDEAKNAGKKTGFQFKVYKDSEPVEEEGALDVLKPVAINGRACNHEY